MRRSALIDFDSLQKSHMVNILLNSSFSSSYLPADPEGPGVCAMFLTLMSFILVVVTMPFSLCVTVKASNMRITNIDTKIYYKILCFKFKFAGGPRVREGGGVQARSAALRGRQGARWHTQRFAKLKNFIWQLQKKSTGLFFIMPCVDSYKKVDLRTVSFDVPPQEVTNGKKIQSRAFPVCKIIEFEICFGKGSLPRLCDCFRGRCCLLQGVKPNHGHQQHRGLQVCKQTYTKFSSFPKIKMFVF